LHRPYDDVGGADEAASVPVKFAYTRALIYDKAGVSL
jgi:hypothetical protein